MSNFAKANVIPSLVFIKTLSKSKPPEFLRIPPDARNLGIAAIVDPADAHMREVLNVDVTSQPQSEAAEIQDALNRVDSVQRTDGIVYAPANGNWRVFVKIGKEFEMVASKAPPSKIEKNQLYQWLTDALGFNAIVTGYNGDLITLSTGETFFSGQQAISFTNSVNHIVVRQETGISAILEAQGNSTEIAFFKPVWKKSIPPVGTKVLLEKQ